MRIFAISDLHICLSQNKPMDIFGTHWENHWQKISNDWCERVSDDDVVIISGDISWALTYQNATLDLDAISKLPGRKILVKGNHDLWWQTITKMRNAYSPNMEFIQNNAVKINNYIFAGSRGWPSKEIDGTFPPSHCVNSKNQDNVKIHAREILRLNNSLIHAKKLAQEGDKIIGLIHYPPFNSRFMDSGFTELFEKNGVCVVIYGHLHGDKPRTFMIYEKSGIKYYLTSCDLLNFKMIEIKI
ncbi:MAG: metallophosphoesterase [Christensenellaceae bacterium]|jgi:predicted phosphohydrolase|nr:metallophosphoesterase [Christensenellaceae bacterium]